MKRVLCYAAAIIISAAAQGQMPAGTVRPYAVSSSLREVANRAGFIKAVPLSQAHTKVLQRNLFVAWPTDDKQLYWVYGRNDYANLPSLVTTDCVLQLYHVFYDSTLRNMEENTLLPALTKLTSAMLDESLRQWRVTSQPALKRAALKNVAYFGFAARALGIAKGVPPDAAALVRRDWDLAEKHQGYTVGAIFPYKIDYSQFVVRGHYTRSPRLQRYFRAMMWYGLVPFAVTTNEAVPRRLDEQIRQGLLLTCALYQGQLTGLWRRIYDPTSVYVGASDMLTPAEWKALMDRVYGPAITVAGLADPGRFNTFANQVQKLRPARIQSAKAGEALPGRAVQLRLMGQRYIPDSEVLQRLTGDDRVFPSGLDVMSVLGSARARAILDSRPELYNPMRWPGYVPERDRLTRTFAALPPATWQSSLYWGWLYALKALLGPVPVGYPSFMRSAAWPDKCLSTSLASWAELRHDTILYGSQSAAEGGDGEQPPFVPGYVEPNVLFYGRLLSLTKRTHAELASRKLVGQAMLRKFADFEDLLSFLLSVSQRELRNGKLTRAEHERIRHIEGEFQGLTETMLKLVGNYLALTEDDLDMALVADVHTGSTSALEEGVGHANYIVAVVPVEGKLYLARGAVFSYYEFLQPISDRLTDAAWRARLKSGRTPPAPLWTRSFLVPEAVRSPR